MLQEIKAGGGPKDSITLVHNGPHVLNPEVPGSKKSPTTDQFSYINPPTAMKLFTALESALKDLNIDVVLKERVQIPSETIGVAEGEWDGSEGLQSGLQKIKLSSGKTLEADYVFFGVGNEPNVSLVEKADPGALVAGLVGVDEYLKVGVILRVLDSSRISSILSIRSVQAAS